MRFFNTEGPVKCEKHYCIEPLERFGLEQVLTLIDREKYFILHAPRQTGKTTCLLALMKYLNRQGDYKCLYINIESAQGARGNVKRAIKAILNELATSARLYLKDTFIRDRWHDVLDKSGEDTALNEMLTLWSEQSGSPLVLLIDEIDALIGDTLISVLRQLRSGYARRPEMFPQSIVLCGLRDLRDYRMDVSGDKTELTGVSPFNIKAESRKLDNFTKDDIGCLYAYHTEETGQTFNAGVMESIWELTNGQPWLVNALADEVTFKMEKNRDRSVSVTVEMIEQAKENIIHRRETHIDHLVDKLREERVKHVMEPLVAGLEVKQNRPDDIQYLLDLGLLRESDQGIVIANGIYREIIPRELTYTTQENFKPLFQTLWYLQDDGRLDMEKLCSDFQQFFRENSESWIQQFDYLEAGPQLLLQAFLQRIINSGGRVEREYGLGRMRTDILIIWPYEKGVQRVVIELKIRYKDMEKTIATGLEQTWKYIDQCGADEGHLVIFDRSKNKSWDQKIFYQEKAFKNKKIGVWGM